MKVFNFHLLVCWSRLISWAVDFQFIKVVKPVFLVLITTCSRKSFKSMKILTYNLERKNNHEYFNFQLARVI